MSSNLAKTKRFAVYDLQQQPSGSPSTGVAPSKPSNWTASSIRSSFLNFFSQKKNHVIWPSSPVVPVNDNTLLFANAGMNQFKPLFLGTCDPTAEMSKLKRAVNSQKCIRAGGKHNDLDDVGKDVYHHTFFEMLGNWSFGDYFKEEAISWAWECLTDNFGLDPERLYVTYFQGDKSQGLEPDLEAKRIWSKFLPESRILPFGCKENFWEMGATGPCGPCTEIHFDRIGNRDASKLVNADLPDVIEIWNNVFIQYNREQDNSLKELPSKHVDTGMGFERLASILQNKSSNYDTDIFMPIFDVIQRVANCRKYTGLVGKEDSDLVDMAYRVVGDHIRTLTFAITDGAIPSNDGRGYVLRRILRRAVRYGQEILRAPPGFFTQLVPVVIEHFSSAFPEIARKQEYVKSIISEEENSFNRTLDLGVKHLSKVVASMDSSDSKVIPATDAHKLYTSMGFPLDLTELMAAEKGFTVDTEGFNQLMENDRKISEAAQNAKKGFGSKNMTMEAEQTAWLSSNSISLTDSTSKYEWNIELPTKVLALFKGRGSQSAGFCDTVTVEDEVVGVILEKSSFYYESGGQVTDIGELRLSNGARFLVEDVQIYGGYVLHVGRLGQGELNVGADVNSCVDYNRRALVAPNHTMTHVLNCALKNVLMANVSSVEASSDFCEQKGSLVDHEKLRFDFSWNNSISIDNLAKIEEFVVQKIQSNLVVDAKVVSLSQASEINGLRHVFGERYPDPVRVISVGVPVADLLANPKNEKWTDISIEFCGGTHLTNTRDAEDFVIVEESGISKGVRRIVAFTKDLAREARNRAGSLDKRLTQLSSSTVDAKFRDELKVLTKEVQESVISTCDKDKLNQKLAELSKLLKTWLKSNLVTRMTTVEVEIDSLINELKAVPKKFIVVNLDLGGDGKLIKKIQDKLKAALPDVSSCILSSDDDGERIGMFVSVSPNHLKEGLDAKVCCSHCTEVLGVGKGGGKSDVATATFPLATSTITPSSLETTATKYFAQFFQK